jgi:hypothetical protein
MGRTAKKINFIIDDDVQRDMETLIPTGKRTKIINEALRRELDMIRRKAVVEKILAAPDQSKRMHTEEIVSSLASDRTSH